MSRELALQAEFGGEPTWDFKTRARNPIVACCGERITFAKEGGDVKIKPLAVFGLLIGGGIFAYHSLLEPAVVRRYATCTFTKYDGPVTHTVQLWFSNQCSWDPERASYILPASFLFGLIFLIIAARFVLDWNSGPPKWACDLAGFGFGALISLAIAAASIGGWWAYLQNVDRHHPDTDSIPGDVKALVLIASFVFWIAMPIGAIWVWSKVTGGISDALEYRSAGAPLTLAGSMVGVTVGIGVACMLLYLAFFVLMVVAMVYAVGILFGLIILGVAFK